MSAPGHELELELTYLAAAIPDGLADKTPKRLVDIYIPEDPQAKSDLRIRQNGSTFEMTKKVRTNPDDASSLVEYTIPLNTREFQTLQNVSSKRVIKDRYEVDVAGRTAEVDVFKDRLEGLIVVDFEFESEAEKGAFIAPSFCGADITQERFIAGGEIAGKSYLEVAPILDRLGYEPLYIVA